jgi:hypothetical protein
MELNQMQTRGFISVVYIHHRLQCSHHNWSKLKISFFIYFPCIYKKYYILYLAYPSTVFFCLYKIQFIFHFLDKSAVLQDQMIHNYSNRGIWAYEVIIRLIFCSWCNCLLSKTYSETNCYVSDVIILIFSWLWKLIYYTPLNLVSNL